MANNRSVALQAALSDYEGLVFKQILEGLMEGKSTPKEKENAKMNYFKCLWERLNLDRVKITDDQSVINHFTVIKKTSDNALAAYCQANNFDQAEFFSSEKIELFNQVIALRQAIALQRYWLSQFAESETPQRLENFLLEQGKRSTVATGRMDNLKETVPRLVANRDAVVDFTCVLINDVKNKNLEFVESDEPPFGKRYEGDVQALSTMLHGLPDKASLDDAIQCLTGKMPVDKLEISAARVTIADGEEKLRNSIEFFEGEWFCQIIKMHDDALKNWLRRSNELTLLTQGLNLQVGRDIFLKIEGLTTHSLERPLKGVIEACKAMPNRAWPKVSGEIEASGNALMLALDAFCVDYRAHHGAFQALDERVTDFKYWREEVSRVVNSYQINVKQLHQCVTRFLKALHKHHDLMKQYEKNKCQRLGFFFKHHGLKIAVGGVLGAGVAFPICFSLLKLELSYSLLYSAASLLMGAGSGGAVGGIKEHCCPTSEEAEPLLIPKPPEPADMDPKPSYFVRGSYLDTFPGIPYRKREADPEQGSIKMERPSYGSMNKS